MGTLHLKELSEYSNLHTTGFQGNMSDIKSGDRTLDFTQFINIDPLRRNSTLCFVVLLFEADLIVHFLDGESRSGLL